jgi:hypothetical protein
MDFTGNFIYSIDNVVHSSTNFPGMDVLEVYSCDTKFELEVRKQDWRDAIATGEPIRIRSWLEKHNEFILNCREDYIREKAAENLQKAEGRHINRFYEVRRPRSYRKNRKGSGGGKSVREGKIRVTCVCGTIVQARSLKLHLKSRNHVRWVDSQPSSDDSPVALQQPSSGVEVSSEA